MELHARDGVRIGAYARGAGSIGLVVVQEIFGVTAHIRRVVDDFAQCGFAAVAPQFFDRVRSGVELDTDAAGVAQGRDLVATLGMDAPLRDVEAAAAALRCRGARRIAVVGYCWGGSLAFLAATRVGLCAVSYYGRLVSQYLHEAPQAPLLFHFGARDETIPAAVIDAIAARYPNVPLHRYDAGHAFNRLGDAHGEPQSAALALQRTIEFVESSAR